MSAPPPTCLSMRHAGTEGYKLDTKSIEATTGPGSPPVAPSLRATSAHRRAGDIRRASAGIAQSPSMTASAFIPATITDMKNLSNMKGLPLHHAVKAAALPLLEWTIQDADGLAPSRPLRSIANRNPLADDPAGCQ